MVHIFGADAVPIVDKIAIALLVAPALSRPSSTRDGNKAVGVALCDALDEDAPTIVERRAAARAISATSALSSMKEKPRRRLEPRTERRSSWQQSRAQSLRARPRLFGSPNSP